MVKCALILGLLAASLSSISAITSSQANVKPFGVTFSDKGHLNTYETPLNIDTSSTPSDFALSGPVKSDKQLTDKLKIAIAYLTKNHRIPSHNIKVTDAYSDSLTGTTYVYVRQVVDGINVSNGDGNVVINQKGQVVASSNSFATSENVDKVKADLSKRENGPTEEESIKNALKVLSDHVGTRVDDNTLEKLTVAESSDFASGDNKYIISGIPEAASADGTATVAKALHQNSDGSLALVWHVIVEQKNDWWSADVDTHTGKVVSLNNWYANASSERFAVYPKEFNDPRQGNRKLLTNPAYTKASPYGWVSHSSTYGNNVWAQSNPSGGTAWQRNYRPTASSGTTFNYALDLRRQPQSYVDSSITQLFYTVNYMHDVSFVYGFDEAAGNFQDVNHSGRGYGSDAVIANTQDGSGTNNANFATPPDGQRPRMRMYIWTQTNPYRDSSFEQGIVAHEYTHGISNRLTGGPANTNCLGYGEAGGMGEGWGDVISFILQIKSRNTHNANFGVGTYVSTRTIRNYPYSTNTRTNPSTYSMLDRSDYQEVHAIGEVWAEMLYEVYWNLADAHGISDNLLAGDLTKGNSLMFRLLLDAMKIQPCRPTFISARNAILQADVNLTGGQNACAIWRGFAKRGLGVNARGGSRHVNDYSVPREC